jgi:hypothetical protein
MKLKNTITAFAVMMGMTLSIGGYAAPTAHETEPARAPIETADPDVQRMMNRLEEIKAMDLENMPRSEKRKYAKEVKQIQKKMKAVGGGVYISAGALIIIIILLILVL